MKALEDVCVQKKCFYWNTTQISSSTVIELEKMVLDVQPKVEREKEK